ncbi:MAG: M42 family metallopeptidase [Ardenticatenaceae bacterium]|nr:M42 family metallopeptidase [Ardenticatenaceae bacterium]HBY93527.1 hydrolase [Chloroflexota bacterium]
MDSHFNLKIDRLKARLRELTHLSGVASAEAEVARYLYNALQPLADEVIADAYGNIIAVRHGRDRGLRLMIAAHSDEVGLMVRAISPDGFLRFHTIGAVSPTVLPATRVLVAGRVPGVIGTVAGHLEVDGVARTRAVSELHIDVGARDEAEVRAWGVREGDPVTFVSELIELHNPRLVMGKAIDNRIGCAVLLEIFHELQGASLNGELFGVVNVMEEMGLRGARMTTSRVRPDWAIALDTVPAEDTPLSTERAFGLGRGPVVQLIEGRPQALVGTAIHPKVRDLLLAVAESAGIPIQLSAQYGHWTTDAAAIHLSGEGVPVGSVSIPRRYSHSPNELLDLSDAALAAQLLTALVYRNGQELRLGVLE